MRRLILGMACASLLAGCGGGSTGGITNPPPPPPAKKLDPYLAIRIRDQLDTTTAVGRAHWHMYMLLTSPQSPGQETIAPQGNVSLEDIRLHHDIRCTGAESDSIGNRFMSLVAFADTTTEALSPDSTAEGIVTRWFAGDHTLPAGWKALVVAPSDAWDSQQWAQGHGLTRTDPIRWAWDWTGSGGSSFYERPVGDDPFCNVL